MSFVPRIKKESLRHKVYRNLYVDGRQDYSYCTITYKVIYHVRCRGCSDTTIQEQISESSKGKRDLNLKDIEIELICHDCTEEELQEHFPKGWHSLEDEVYKVKYPFGNVPEGVLNPLCHALKHCRIVAVKLNQGKASASASGWHYYVRRTGYLPYTK